MTSRSSMSRVVGPHKLVGAIRGAGRHWLTDAEPIPDLVQN
jgi:hypothetical protein